jgi:2-(1,2-epoxy-1,2-dihydrophenyl)acetyl-CoA isomerase
MTGDKLPAEEAERIGLIWKCVDDVQLMEQVMTLANRLAAMSSKALAETRLAIDAALPMDFPSALAREAQVQGRMGRGPDFAEGVSAFLAKRPAVFKDR